MPGASPFQIRVAEGEESLGHVSGSGIRTPPGKVMLTNESFGQLRSTSNFDVMSTLADMASPSPQDPRSKQQLQSVTEVGGSGPTRSDVETFKRAVMLRRGFGAWSRLHEDRLAQESFALSCADLWKLGKAFDRWLTCEEPPAPEQPMVAEKSKPPAVNPYATALRRKRCLTPNRSRGRQSSPRTTQQAAHTPGVQFAWAQASPATRESSSVAPSAAERERFGLSPSAPGTRDSFSSAPSTRENFSVSSRSSAASDSSFGTRDRFASPHRRAADEIAKERAQVGFSSKTFSVSYSFAEKVTTPTTPRAGEPGAVRRFTRMSTDSTPWRGDSMPWYNERTASCIRKAWPERNPYPADGAKRDASWKDWQWAIKANVEANCRARARDWATRRAWLEDRRINTPSKIVPWHVSDGGPSHRNMCEATDKLVTRVTHVETAPSINEELGRDLTGHDPWYNTRSRALLERKMELIVNDN